MGDKNWQQQQGKHELKVKRLEGRILPDFAKAWEIRDYWIYICSVLKKST